VSPGHVIAAVAAALLLAFALWRRRSLGGERVLVCLLAALALALYASGLLSRLPNAKTVITNVAEALGPWTYALVGALAYLETGAFVGLVAPGETVIMVGGVIAGQGEIQVIPLIGIVWVAAILGDATSFFIGRRLGREFLLKHGGRVKITPERLAQVEGYFDRHGGSTILVGRFIGLVRALAPFVAGASRLSYRRFAPYSIVGTGLWATLYCLLGYLFYRSFDRVAGIAGRATLVFAILVSVATGGTYAYRRLRHPEERRRLAAWLDRQAERPLLRPLAAVARPLWRSALAPAGRAAAPELRFLGRRLTPGGLGIELTTALAAGGIGLYLFTVYAVTIGGGTRLTPADHQVMQLADDLRTPALVDVAKMVTTLGALPTVTVVALATAGLLASRRHPVELAAFLAGSIAVYVTLQAAKAGIDRPRPSGGLVAASGSSYPSGHAAYSTVWVAAAIVLTRVIPGIATGATLVVAGLVVAAAIGLSRVYLGVHYWSDVVGGWGLGVGVFAVAAVMALVVTHIRHNGSAADGQPASPDR
jgi:undecaprenyl-diphosphatase